MAARIRCSPARWWAADRRIQPNHIVSTVETLRDQRPETDRDTGQFDHLIRARRGPGPARLPDRDRVRSDPGSVMCAPIESLNGTPCLRAPPGRSPPRAAPATGAIGRAGVMSDRGATHPTAPAANAGLDQVSGLPAVWTRSSHFGALLGRALAKGRRSPRQLRLDTRWRGRSCTRCLHNGPPRKADSRDAPIDLSPRMLADQAAATRRRSAARCCPEQERAPSCRSPGD